MAQSTLSPAFESPYFCFYPIFSVPKQESKQYFGTLRASMKTITVALQLSKHKEFLSTFLSTAVPILQIEIMLYLKVSCFTLLIFEVPSLRQTELGISCTTHLHVTLHIENTRTALRDF